MEIGTESNSGLTFRYSLAPDLSAPLALLVHGRAGSYQSMSTFVRTLPKNMHVFMPQATLNEMGGFSWWDVNGKGSLIERANLGFEKLSAFLSGVIGQYGLGASDILAAGFSQGSGLVSLLLQRRPELLRVAALLAGFVIRDENAPARIGQQLPKVFIAHGTKDSVVPISMAEEGASYLRSQGYEVTFMSDDVDHKVGVAGTRALAAFLKEQYPSNLNLPTV